MAGKKICIYIDGAAMPAFEALSEVYGLRGKSASYMVSRALESFCMQMVSGVRISEGAYACMAQGKMDKLDHIHLPGVDAEKDGYPHIITCSEEAYKGDAEVAGEVRRIRAVLKR